MSFKVERIIVHHSATRDSGTVSWGAIRNYHRQTNGWRDIGYHAGIELVGSQYVVQQGRPITVPGAHTVGQNQRSLGFCFVGDYDAVAPEERMLEQAAREVLAPWCKQFGLPVTAIFGHRDYAEKTCPGKLFDVDALRDLVAAELAKG